MFVRDEVVSALILFDVIMSDKVVMPVCDET